MDLSVAGLTGSWDPMVISLNQFPAPPGMPLVNIWPTATSSSVAVGSLGMSTVYTTGASVPTTFEPQLVISINNGDPTTSLIISLLSITIEHAAP
jgi:hypothetical protein